MDEALSFQVRLLAAGLGFPDVPPAEAVPAEVIALAREGHAIEAIRRLRKLRGPGLLQAKRIVDAIGTEPG